MQFSADFVAWASTRPTCSAQSGSSACGWRRRSAARTTRGRRPATVAHRVAPGHRRALRLRPAVSGGRGRGRRRSAERDHDRSRSPPVSVEPWHHENVTTSAPAMIGRDADLARLNERLDEVRAGAPFTVIIGGEAGIGKTRLIREFEAGLPVRRPAARGAVRRPRQRRGAVRAGEDRDAHARRRGGRRARARGRRPRAGGARRAAARARGIRRRSRPSRRRPSARSRRAPRPASCTRRSPCCSRRSRASGRSSS